MKRRVDSIFLTIVITLLVGGFFIFLSASLGLLARETTRFSGIVFNQVFSLCIGIGAALLVQKIDYRLFKKYSLHILIGAVLLNLVIFIPGLGLEHGGATRWLTIGSFSLQPSEFLKLAFIMYFATWLNAVRTKVRTFAYGLIPLGILLSVIGAILLKQPDTGTFLVIFVTGLGMFIASGARWKHILTTGGAAVVGVAVLALVRPYVRERIMTFINPALDPHGAGYQIQQSLIAIGSGGIFGRGFGQSIQKFNYLPEPVGDSIFAVFSEEFGLMGGIALMSLFVAFALRGFVLARRAPDHFSRLLVAGIVILITTQAFMNMGAMLGVVPLTGIPLPFISHGGSALIAVLLGTGIVLSISRHARR